jgi:hypothetical protein
MLYETGYPGGMTEKAIGIVAVLLAVIPAPAADQAPERLEVVARDVSTGDGGNSWGAHKLRIVRTPCCVYTAYATGAENLKREFRLAQRTDAGWRTVLEGPGGREPVNVLAAPDGSVRLVAWPQGLPLLYTGAGSGDDPQFRREAVPGNWERNDWPYHGAAMASSGTLYIVKSYGDTPGGFRVARLPAKGKWGFKQSPVLYRHCYAIAFPLARAGHDSLAWVAVRDILWEHLGWKAPPGVFRYLFNGLQLFELPDGGGLQVQQLKEEPQTDEFLNARCSHSDAYADKSGRMHVLYQLRGASTGGRTVSRHMVLDAGGKPVADVELPISGQWRIVQNASGVFYLMMPSGGSLLVYRSHSADGTELDAPRQCDLKTARVVDHLFLATPRAGVAAADFVDGTFLSAENNWVYFRIRL